MVINPPSEGDDLDGYRSKAIGTHHTEVPEDVQHGIVGNATVFNATVPEESGAGKLSTFGVIGFAGVVAALLA